MKVENCRSDAGSLSQLLALNPNTVWRLPADAKDQRPLQFIKQQEKDLENWMDGVTETEVNFQSKMFSALLHTSSSLFCLFCNSKQNKKRHVFTSRFAGLILLRIVNHEVTVLHCQKHQHNLSIYIVELISHKYFWLFNAIGTRSSFWRSTIYNLQ